MFADVLRHGFVVRGGKCKEVDVEVEEIQIGVGGGGLDGNRFR